MRNITTSSLLLAFVFPLVIGLPTAQAVTETEQGIASFNKHDYKNALTHFATAIKSNPNDSTAFYYEAITLHQLKQMDLAKQAYAAVIARFPNTAAASNAQRALSYLDPSYARNMQQQITSGRNGSSNTVTNNILSSPRTYAASDTASLPDQARVPYQKDGNHLIVSVYVNNRPIQMMFDSGAEAVSFQRSQLENLGISCPPQGHIFLSYGVGNGGGQKTWEKVVTLKVGQIERRNFVIDIQEDVPNSGMSTYPLLGESFFKDFSYTFESSPDQTRGTILFQKKSIAAASFGNDTSIVPFKNVGRNIIVPVEVNGKTIQMFYDTGAHDCCFTRQQWQSMGFTIPDDAVAGTGAGIAGSTNAMMFTVPRMRLGPVIKQDVQVSVIDSGDMPYPLLGGTFLGDLRVDIDNSAHVMRVRR